METKVRTGKGKKETIMVETRECDNENEKRRNRVRNVITTGRRGNSNEEETKNGRKRMESKRRRDWTKRIESHIHWAADCHMRRDLKKCGCKRDETRDLLR